MWLLVVLFVLIPSAVLAQVQKCEDQLALSNQLVQDINQDRGRIQVEAAALKVQIGTLLKELQEIKAKSIPKEEKK